MANPFIHYDVKNGVEYVSVSTSCRINGKKSNEPEYLGSVIDKEKCLFRSRKRGVFTYNLKNGYGETKTDDYTDASIHGASNNEKLILDFFYKLMRAIILRITSGDFTETMPATKRSLSSLGWVPI